MDAAAILDEISALPCKEDGRVYISWLDKLVPKYRRRNDLAQSLWQTGNVNARLFAMRIADPRAIDETLFGLWLPDLDSWDLCDSFCGVVARSSFAEDKARAWVHLDGEYQRRAGFALIAQMAWAKNDYSDAFFIGALSDIECYASDERYYVKKAVNWALRDIGKHNNALKPHAQAVAALLSRSDDKIARWVGTHRMKEIA